MSLIAKIQAREATVGVICLGYVGLPLAVELARAGFKVIGFDVIAEKVERVNAGNSYIKDVSTAALGEVVKSGHLRASGDFALLRQCDTVEICVPTPLNKTKDPDMRYIASATAEIAAHLHPNLVVVLESTTYPGTTREVVGPKLESAGAKLGVDTFVAFSPERVDPGNTVWNTRNTPEIIGGISKESTELAAALYGKALETIVPVSSAKVAEMVKLLENTFRHVPGRLPPRHASRSSQ